MRVSAGGGARECEWGDVAVWTKRGGGSSRACGPTLPLFSPPTPPLPLPQLTVCCCLRARAAGEARAGADMIAESKKATERALRALRESERAGTTSGGQLRSACVFFWVWG